jgi:hypothetical protein
MIVNVYPLAYNTSPVFETQKVNVNSLNYFLKWLSNTWSFSFAQEHFLSKRLTHTLHDCEVVGEQE